MSNSVLQELNGSTDSLMFHCLGCDMEHVIYTKNSKVCWGWNGSMDKPTFTPSYLCAYPWGEERKKVVCHSFIVDGNIQYLNDCTHHLSGKTVPLPAVEVWP